MFELRRSCSGCGSYLKRVIWKLDGLKLVSSEAIVAETREQ